MIKFMKKLAALILAIGLVSISCATAQVQLLGGNPRVETIEMTIGMSVEKLDRELGPPMDTDTCAFPFEANGEPAKAQGRAFLWKHETANMPEQTARAVGIIVCVMNDIVVAEHREWMIRNGSIVSTGQTDTVDLQLIQVIMDSLLKPGNTPAITLPKKGFEI